MKKDKTTDMSKFVLITTEQSTCYYFEKSKDFLTSVTEGSSVKNTKAKSYQVEIKYGFGYLLVSSHSKTSLLFIGKNSGIILDINRSWIQDTERVGNCTGSPCRWASSPTHCMPQRNGICTRKVGRADHFDTHFLWLCTDFIVWSMQRDGFVLLTLEA